MTRSRGLGAMLLALALSGCAMAEGEASAVPAAPSAESKFFAEYDRAYAPLRDCAAAARSRIGNAMGQELVDAGLLEALEYGAKQLLGAYPDTLKVAEATSSPPERAAALLQALRDFGVDENSADPGYQIFQLRRHVAADALLGQVPSVGCEVSQELLRWQKEAADMDAYSNLATEYQPLMNCSADWLERNANSRSGFPAALVADGGLADLQALTAEFLDADDPALGSSRLAVDDAERARLLLQGLIGYGAGSADTQPYAEQARRLLAMIEARRLLVSAMKLDCETPKPLLVWMEFARNEYL